MPTSCQSLGSRRRAEAAAAAILALALLLHSCASAPAVPAWALSTPAPDGRYTYFVGYAGSDSGDLAKASEDAAANLVASIMSYIGVKVTVESSASAKATFDSYAAEVTQTVKTQSTNRMAGFTVTERYVYKDPKSSRTTVYILASYLTQDLEKEKARIAVVFQEKADAVSKPEAEARALVEAGRTYDAVRKFVEAAAAASGADIDNADLKLERNLSAALKALSTLRLERVADSYQGFLGRPFAEPFRARLVQGDGSAARPVPGAALLVSYQRRQGTRTVARTEPAATDAQGALSFSPPPPDFVGKANFVVRVDFQELSEQLDRVPPRYAALRDALRAEMEAKVLTVAYSVASAAKSVPTALLLVDLDEKGFPAGRLAQAGLTEALGKEGFDLKPLSGDPAASIGAGEESLVAAARAANTMGAERLVYGSARLVGVRKDGSAYFAEGSIAAKAIELGSGRLLYAVEKGATGFGSDEAAARRSLYRELGLNALGKELLQNLP